MCILPQSQTAHRRVKIKIFVSLWLLLKGQSGEILLEVNTSTMKEKIWRIFFYELSLKFWLCYVWRTPRSRNFRTLWSNISCLSEKKSMYSVSFQNSFSWILISSYLCSGDCVSCECETWRDLTTPSSPYWRRNSTEMQCSTPSRHWLSLFKIKATILYSAPPPPATGCPCTRFVGYSLWQQDYTILRFNVS